MKKRATICMALMIIGGLINTWSVYGYNGYMGDWQTHMKWPVITGIIIFAPGALGVLALIGIALKNWICTIWKR